MGRYYKNQLHGPIQDYAYELPFNELFTMQKYKRAEDDKAKEALQAGYDALYKINYKPGDEAKVAQLRNNFSNLTDNIYKKYGNNLANATGSIQQGINAVLDSGLLSDINANYKTWTANETSKAALYKSGQFQPNLEVDIQGARPTEDAQGRRRDYEQYLASTDIRPNQQEIYDDIPQAERTRGRLMESARASALQYALAHPQDLIQRYGEGINSLYQAIELGDEGALKTLESFSLEMLKETLPEFRSTPPADDSDGSGGGSDGTEEPVYVPDQWNDLMNVFSTGGSAAINATDLIQIMGLEGDQASAAFMKGSVPIITGSDNIIINPGVFASSNAGFILNSDGSYTYDEQGLNIEESARQASELSALDHYFETYAAQKEELGLEIEGSAEDPKSLLQQQQGPGFTKFTTGLPTDPADIPTADSKKIAENPNLKRSALKRIEELGIDPEDPETLELYKAYLEQKKNKTPDQRERETTSKFITALQKEGIRLDFVPLGGPSGNSFVSVGPNGEAVLNIRGIATLPKTAIENLISSESGVASSEDGSWKPWRALGIGKDAWDYEGSYTSDGPGLVGPGKLFEKTGVGKVTDSDGSSTGEQLYTFNMTQQIPINWTTKQKFNAANFEGTTKERGAVEGVWKEKQNEFNILNVEKALKKQIESKTNKQVPKLVKKSGIGPRTAVELNYTNFENSDINNSNKYRVNAKGVEAINSSSSKVEALFNTLGKTTSQYNTQFEIYKALSEELINTEVDGTSQDEIKKYAEKARDFYDISNLLENADMNYKKNSDTSGDVSLNEAMNKLLDTSETVLNTGIENGKVVNPTTLRDFTKLKAEATPGMVSLKELVPSLSRVELAQNLYGPYASTNASNLLKAFNNSLQNSSTNQNAVLTSAYRTKAYNATLREHAKDSAHTYGKAFDLRDNDAAAYLYQLYTEGNFKDIINNFFVHDVGGVKHYHLSIK